MEQISQWFIELFEFLPLGTWISNVSESIVVWLTINAKPFFDLLTLPVEWLFNGLNALLGWVPWPFVVLAFIWIGWRNGGRRVGAVAGIGLVLAGLLGYWELTMETLAMVLSAMLISVVLGIPLGIAASRNDGLDQALRLALDGMQTIHPFVYLVPIVMLLSIGNVPSIIATIIFALPPIVRLTNLGIRQVPKETVEAGRSFGASERQLLWDVQIPLALPTIMAGLNQTLMLALSMVVIAALIAGGGLGQEILRSVGRLDIGRAVTSGLAVLILAIVLDRVSQGRSQQTTE
ncbi:MAG: ABC transporter permease subunit [Anaerolineales bacterium]|nr:ABC transporter permease subunit [Anaerolineales bacterium]MCB0008805.1 ABC transporter permease subunit [Anaerolineales bacterium]MCB0017170.1 ABC transporter permease subunit [Anaerolineales bacterium]MCB0026445.1 ABC transporter permease subunit [Anaerolineales bacterium]MCB8958851.1 ABC transporter permease subunit [Ardenticatenales bacterium]